MVIERIVELLKENIQTYYGLDWLTIIFGVIGYLFITEKKSIGFLFNALSVTFAATVALIASQYGFLIANSVQLIVAIRAYIKWRQDEVNN
ncbi:MAG: hypothetical protein ACLFPL_01065 [Candidatus Nanoarchaeia archaeon]